MKLHSKIHAYGPQLVFTDPVGFSASQHCLVGHAGCEYHEAAEDAATIVGVLAIHPDLVIALQQAKLLLGDMDVPMIDKALADVEAI